MSAMLDRLRGTFLFAVALVLPLPGAIMAIARFADGDREEGIRLAALALLGTCVWALLLL